MSTKWKIKFHAIFDFLSSLQRTSCPHSALGDWALGQQRPWMCRRARDHQPGRPTTSPPQSCECMRQPQGTLPPQGLGTCSLGIWVLLRGTGSPQPWGPSQGCPHRISQAELQPPPRVDPRRPAPCQPLAPEPGPDPSSFPGHPPLPSVCCCPRPASSQQTRGLSRWGEPHSPVEARSPK